MICSELKCFLTIFYSSYLGSHDREYRKFCLSQYGPIIGGQDTILTSENKEAFDIAVKNYGHASQEIDDILKKNDIDTALHKKKKDNPFDFMEANYTSLMYATAISDMDSIKILIENGANVNGKNPIGQTPLYYINQFNDNQTILSYLLSNGADINIQDNLGRTPLYFNAWIGSVKRVKALLEHGANPNIKRKDKNIMEILHEKQAKLKNSANTQGLEDINAIIEILEPKIQQH